MTFEKKDIIINELMELGYFKLMKLAKGDGMLFTWNKREFAELIYCDIIRAFKKCNLSSNLSCNKMIEYAKDNNIKSVVIDKVEKLKECKFYYY